MPFAKKLFGFSFGIFLVLTLTGFGCKGLSKNQQQAMRPVVLEYWTVFDDVNAVRVLVDQYRQQRPYIQVNIRQLRPDEIYPRLLEALAEDRGPDIISVSNRNLDAYLPKLQPMPPSVRDTTMRVEKSTVGGETTIVNTQTKALMTEAQLDRDYVKVVRKDAVRGGKIYGLPLSLDVMALYYNKDLLDRAGIPQPPKTWEEFQEQVKKLTKFERGTGKIIQSGAALGGGPNIPGSSDLIYVLFEQSKIPFVDSLGKAVFNQMPKNLSRSEDSPANTVMSFYTDFSNSTRDTYSWNDSMPNAFDSFVNGSLAFFFGYSYHHSQIVARAPQLNFDVLPMLQLAPENSITSANYWLQSVLLKSKHPNEAWGLIDFLTHSSATKQYLEQTGRPTALRFYVNEQMNKPKLAPFASQVLTAGNWYRGKDYEAANKAVQDMFKEWLQPAAENKVNEWRQNVLNRASAKVNQTL